MRSILVIQPNSTQSMTDALKPLVDSLQFKNVNQHHSQQHHTATNDS
jgi:Asp/Glu/hydantoin racemase